MAKRLFVRLSWLEPILTVIDFFVYPLRKVPSQDYLLNNTSCDRGHFDGSIVIEVEF